jgi:cytochrome P450
MPVLQTAQWLARPLAFLESCRRRVGDTFSVRFVGHRTPLVMISDPAKIRALYTERENRLPPGRAVVLRPLVGSQSILLQDGADQLQRRRLMLQAFHGQRMRAHDDLIAAIAERELDRCPLGQPFPLQPHMQRVTFDVILKAVLGVSDTERLERLRRLIPQLLDTASSAMPLRLLVRGTRDAGQVSALRLVGNQIDRELFAEISRRRRDPAVSNRQDILSMLIHARFEDSSEIDDQELRADGRSDDQGHANRGATPLPTNCDRATPRCLQPASKQRFGSDTVASFPRSPPRQLGGASTSAHTHGSTLVIPVRK